MKNDTEIPDSAPVLNFWFEWRCSSPFWPANDSALNIFGFGEVEPIELGLPENLATQLEQHCAWHDTSLNWNYPTDPSPWRQEECDRFNVRSMELFTQCQSLLEPAYKLVYKQYKSMEDPDLDRYLENPKDFKRMEVKVETQMSFLVWIREAFKHILKK